MKARTVLVLMFSGVMAMPGRAQPPYIGDYDAELRTDGHVDNELMVERLRELGANTYMWLIWHSPNDWADLHEFLPLAAEADITVWVYLVPPSETAATHPQFPYSEPFRLDYVRWAEEIAKLSLQHKNLVGYVIDDFWGNVNPRWFTLESIGAMVDAGRAINPEIKFYPLMYFNQIGPRFIQMLGTVVDGVVAAYPRDREAIERALRFLNGEFVVPAAGSIVYPWDAPSQAGDHGLLRQRVRVTDAEHVTVTFCFTDDFDGPTTGYHFLQARVDDQVVWEEDVAGADDGEVTIDVSEQTAGKRDVTLVLGIFDRRGVANFGVTATFSDLRAVGLDPADLEDQEAWSEDIQGAFSTALTPRYEPEEPIHLPLIVMPAGQRGEYQHRYGEEATAERIAAQYRMCLQLVAEGATEGVVSYCLDKSVGNPDFEAVRQVIADYRAGE